MARVFIGIGSSINRKENIHFAIQTLQTEFGPLTCSAIYESEAVGFDGKNFYNLVLYFDSYLNVQEIIDKLKVIEIQQGRPKKTIKFAPRTIDLDLLLYDQLINLKINLPRAEIVSNAFVLQPLSEIAPHLQHPILNTSYQVLWEKFPKKQQKLWKIDTINH
ncbi:MAG: 2-amino-4-hydroxy-6-hydroxymethyldihydropteridine diphosphokinase [Psychromonas sp.]